MERARNCILLRQTTHNHVPEVQVQGKCRTASLSNQECQLFLRQSQQQQVPVVEFQVELRQAFLAEIPKICGFFTQQVTFPIYYEKGKKLKKKVKFLKGCRFYLDTKSLQR
ncbi:SNRPN upstream reading frame protein-like [Pipistrellus kuhlii]|uniref:SNRPN upstream reading frame protein-like n=1 Tax=Pipistrellus kuhlii TaxID=59472 RepID=UPI00174EFB1A|nr:SNRPN upstream reading frame protein-like [Pipistrellus kuhlii]